MLSRFTRMSSLGAHLVSGCTALKDTPTAPKPVAQLESSARSGSFIASKENSPGCLPEPFLWHDHDNFLAELSELDHWKNDLTPSTCRTSPERQSSTLDDSAEWSSILHSIEWIDKFEALDIPKVDSDCSTSDYPESSSRDESCDFVEKTASLVDWKAWNCYLGLDEDLNFNMDLKTENSSIAEERSQCEGSQATPPDVEVKTENDIEEKKDPPYLCELRTGSVALNSRLNEIENAIVRSSGPLTWLPCVKEEDQCSELSSRSTPSSIDVFNQIRTVKRRGVKMKPPSDDETNHRRWLNREAAFRYRERKRMEQLERKKELDDLLQRNSFLKHQVRQLSREVALWQQKLDNANI